MIKLTIKFVDQIIGKSMSVETPLVNLLKYSLTFIDFFTEFRQYSFDIPFPVYSSTIKSILKYLNTPNCESYSSIINDIEDFSNFIRIWNFFQIPINYGQTPLLLIFYSLIYIYIYILIFNGIFNMLISF